MGPEAAPELTVPVAISARHVHLTPKSIAQLFGPGESLHPSRPLTQPGQYACRETVTLLGPRGALPHVRIVGPPREEDQVELSRTDEMALGLDAPVRVSGDLQQTPGIQLLGPAGQILLPHGVVIAQRHVHMNPTEAARFSVHDRQVVQAVVHSAHRSLVFDDVIVRVAPRYSLELHLDTDEGNAAGIQAGDRAALRIV